MKNTSVNPSATFDQMPSPNQTMKIGASTTRGMAFIAVMYGSRMAEALGESPSHNPIASPATEPRMKASAVSWSVTQRCW